LAPDAALVAALGPLRRVEDYDVADRRVLEVVEDAVDEHALADVERRLHRLRRDLVRLHDPALDPEREGDRQADDHDQPDYGAPPSLRLRDQPPFSSDFASPLTSSSPSASGSASSSSSPSVSVSVSAEGSSASSSAPSSSPSSSSASSGSASSIVSPSES